jgi:spore germination protein GerM
LIATGTSLRSSVAINDGVDVVLSVEFMLDEAAKAFAKRFSGKDAIL